MANCPNFAIPDVAEKFNELETIFGEKMAYFFWNKNGGYSLDLNTKGEKSILFQDILDKKEVNGNRTKALKIKSQIYLNNFNEIDIANLPISESNVQLEIDFTEPSVDKLNISKADLTDSHTNIYSQSQITQEEYDKLPYKESLGIVKTAMFTDRRSADNLANQYGSKVIDVNTRGGLIYKVPISNPNRGIDFLPKEVELPKNVQEIITRKKNRKQALEHRLVNKSSRSAEIKASISMLNSQIKKIEDEYSNAALSKIAYSDVSVIDENLKMVAEELKNTDLNDARLRDLMEVIIENSYNIKGWLDISALINSEEDELKGSIDLIQGKISRLSNDYHNLMADVYLRYINQKTHKSNFTKNDILGAINDISGYKANALSISETHIPLLQTADDLIKTMADKINEAHIKKSAELTLWKKKLMKHTGKSEEEVSKMFLQYDEKGEWTGNFIGRYSQLFFDKKSQMAEASRKSDNWKPYYNWIAKNSKSMTNAQLVKINNLSADQIEKLSEEKAIGVFSKEEVISQKKLLDEFLEDQQAQLDLMMMDHIFSKGTLLVKDGKAIFTHENSNEELNFNLELEGWRNVNSPYIYSSSKDQKEKRGDSYIINARPNDNWLDSQYKDLQKDETLYGFYKYMKKTFKENNEYLPHFNGLQDNYMPEIKTSLLDRIKAAPNTAAKFALLSNELKIALTDEVARQEDSSVYINGKQVRNVPIYMMDNKLSTENKESNIFTVINEHNKNSLNYKYKSEIEPITNAAIDLLETVDEIQKVDINGVPVSRTKFGVTVKRPGRLVNAKEMLDFVVGGEIYNKTQEVEGRSGIKLKVSEDKKKIKELTKKLEDESLNQEEFDEAISLIGREFTGSRSIDLLNTFTYLKQMSLPNVITPTVNAVFGVISNMTYASAGEDVSEKEMAAALITMSSISSQHFGAKFNKEIAFKVYAFMNRFKLIGDIHDVDTGKSKSFSEIVTILQSKAEFFNQGSLMIGILKTQKLKDKNGKEVSVFDAYKEKDGVLLWNTELMGEEKEVSSDRVFSEDMNQVNTNALGKYLDAVNRRVHGDYKNTLMIKKKALWRAVMLYKRWLPQAIDHRFGAEFENKDLLGKDGKRGRITKGRYTSLWTSKTKEGVDVTGKAVLGMMLKGMVTKKAFSDLAEVDRVNLIRNVRELQYVAMIYGMVVALQAMFGDDGDDSWALKMMINTLSKTQADMMFFLNPNSANQILNNAIPAISTIGDLIRVIDSLGKATMGDIYYENGPWKDQSRLKVNAMRALPLTSGTVKMYNYSTRIFDYN